MNPISKALTDEAVALLARYKHQMTLEPADLAKVLERIAASIQAAEALPDPIAAKPAEPKRPPGPDPFFADQSAFIEVDGEPGLQIVTKPIRALGAPVTHVKQLYYPSRGFTGPVAYRTTTNLMQICREN